MKMQTFRGPELAAALELARRAFGDDAMILQTRIRRDGGRSTAEVVAVSAQDVAWFQRRLQADPLPALRGKRPFVLALVGPTGAGKTTTLAKLALHPQAFGERRVGLLTLDTYRVGAMEQLTTFAEIAGLPLEVAYHESEVGAALRRLNDCDVVLVDTPGRSPRVKEQSEELEALLAAVRPDEVHLVVPATLRLDIVSAVHEAYEGVGPTHLLLTKLDEVPGESGLADAALLVDLPARWVTDGQEVPADARPAVARILASLGLSPSAVSAVRGAA